MAGSDRALAPDVNLVAGFEADCRLRQSRFDGLHPGTEETSTAGRAWKNSLRWCGTADRAWHRLLLPPTVATPAVVCLLTLISTRFHGTDDAPEYDRRHFDIRKTRGDVCLRFPHGTLSLQLSHNNNRSSSSRCKDKFLAKYKARDNLITGALLS